MRAPRPGDRMANPIQIRMGGYGPATTGSSRSLKLISDRLTARCGDAVDIKYVWNIMDLGYRAEDILWLVEHGLLTLGYQSSSYLTDRVPELGFVDLPFLFAHTERARAAVDGALGQLLADKIEERVNYRILGFFENGFRPLSNRLRPVRIPARAPGHPDRGSAEPTPGADLRAPGRGAAAARSHRGDRHDHRRRDRRAGKSPLQHRHLRGAHVPPLPYAHQPRLHLSREP